MEPTDRMIVALDVPDLRSARARLDLLEGQARWVKVGLELFASEGPGVVKTLAADGLSVFLDLKLHDIPQTVARTVRCLDEVGAALVTVHATGGLEMLRQAQRSCGHLRLLAVTVLTSLDEADLRRLGFDGGPKEQAVRLAKLAHSAGVMGLVASAWEAAELKREIGPESWLVVPGIRARGDAAGDQRRVMTAGEAMRQGADQLVLGRTLFQDPDPAGKFRAIAGEIEEAAHA